MYYSDSKEEKDENSDDEYSDESDSENSMESSGLLCTNMDPRLAKLMGIWIEEQAQEIDWKPPDKSGLENSAPIISYTSPSSLQINRDHFKEIKDAIQNHRTLTDKQLEYIQTLTNEEKYELIKIYNTLLTVKNK